MKKALVFVFAALLVFCLAACGAETASQAPSATDETLPSVEIKENEFESKDESDIPTGNTDIGGDGEEQTSSDEADGEIAPDSGDSVGGDLPVSDGADSVDSAIDSND